MEDFASSSPGGDEPTRQIASEVVFRSPLCEDTLLVDFGGTLSMRFFVLLYPITVLATSVVCFYLSLAPSLPLPRSACCVLIICYSRRALHFHLPFV